MTRNKNNNRKNVIGIFIKGGKWEMIMSIRKTQDLNEHVFRTQTALTNRGTCVLLLAAGFIFSSNVCNFSSFCENISLHS